MNFIKPVREEISQADFKCKADYGGYSRAPDIIHSDKNEIEDKIKETVKDIDISYIFGLLFHQNTDIKMIVE